MSWLVIESPIGDLRLVADGPALVAIEFSPFGADVVGEHDPDHPVLRAAADQLAEYFAGERASFELPLAPRGTDFQSRVWQELRRVGHGERISYGELASRIGLPAGSARAVGAANGANPLPIVVPCHRVVGADGSLTGYAGGLPRKQLLLDLERPTLFD